MQEITKIVNLQPEVEIDHSSFDAEWKKIGKSVENIHLIHNFIDDEDLSMLYNYVEKYKDDDSFRGGNDKRKKDVIETDPDIHILMEKYEQLIYEQVFKFYTEKYGVKIKRVPVNDLHFVKWPEGMQSKLHADCERPDGKPAYHANFYRLNISCLLYLNDNYGGGELQFPEYGFSFKPKPGDLAIFPSNHRHLITAVEGKNNRYTMPIWFTFDLPDVYQPAPDDAEGSIILWKNDGETYKRSETF